MGRLTPFTVFDVSKVAAYEYLQGFYKEVLRIQEIEEGCETL